MMISLQRILVVLVIMLMFGCGKHLNITIDGENQRVPFPPGMSRIGENLFMDALEVNVSDYLFYVSWMEYQQDSTYYDSSQLYYKNRSYHNVEIKDDDTGVSFAYYRCFESYWSHPISSSYPIIGVSYPNALEYTQWRQNRILEVQLISHKLIDPTHVQQNPITLEALLAGEVKLLPSTLESIMVPVLSLPDSAAYALATKAAVPDFEASQGTKRRYKRYLPWLLFDENSLPCAEFIDLKGDINPNNRYAIYNLRASADEYLSTDYKEDVGSVYKAYSKDEIKIVSGLGDASTGFRNIAYYIKVSLPEIK